MADIKLKEHKRNIKIFDKATSMGNRVKNTYVRTKENMDNISEDNSNSPNEYAEDKIRTAAESTVRTETARAKRNTQAIYKTGKGHYKTYKEIKKAKNADITKPVKQISDKSVKTAKKSVKNTNKAVKTAKKTSKTAIKTSKEVAKTTKETAKVSVRAAKATARAAKAAAKATVVATKAAMKATIAAIKAIIAATKALVAAIAAGGWVAVIIIIIICLIGLVISCFGIFFSGEDTGTGMTMQTVVSEINTEYQNKIEQIKSNNTYDEVEITGLNPVWKDVLAIYAAKTTFDPNNPQEVASMDASKKEILKNIFWDMNSISSKTETKNVSVPTETVDADGNISVTYTNESKTYLYITVTHKTTSEMPTVYNFNANQRQLLNELLSNDFDDAWGSALYGISGGSKKLISVAMTQIGNSGGQPYWSWYGFNSRVEWCACFVSWCAKESGYINTGIIPKFASCEVGKDWFRNRDQWKTNTYTPREGDIIFFNWDDNPDADHVGIVEKVENGKVYTIEGNSGDACKKLNYNTNDSRILGYGVPAY